MKTKRIMKSDNARRRRSDAMEVVPVSSRPLACCILLVSSFCSAFNIELKIAIPDQLPIR